MDMIKQTFTKNNCISFGWDEHKAYVVFKEESLNLTISDYVNIKTAIEEVTFYITEIDYNDYYVKIVGIITEKERVD